MLKVNDEVVEIATKTYKKGIELNELRVELVSLQASTYPVGTKLQIYSPENGTKNYTVIHLSKYVGCPIIVKELRSEERLGFWPEAHPHKFGHKRGPKPGHRKVHKK